MAGEIFISYRRADEAWARLLHNQLQAEGVEAWYDAQVGAGQDWRIATAKALQASRIFVLLFSSNAAQSGDIAKELAAAVFEKKLIIPVRLEDIAPEGAFLYELASRNWVNAFENTEAKLAELAKALARLVRTGAQDESVLPFDRSHGNRHAPAARRPMHPAALIAAAALVVVAAAAIGFHTFIPPSGQIAAKAPPAAAAGLPSLPRPAGISVAVLPFLNLSHDPGQDFFSDGMTEEITAALAQVKGLRVIGRTSAFAFKGKNEDLRVIGQTLGATNLIEGSVRKEGNQLRITVQLIKADDDFHLWAQSYDRELKDVFAVQEDIARTIAASLQVPLGLKQGEALVPDRAIDAGSYQDYLRAKAQVRSRLPGTTSMNIPIATLESIVARQPDYAPAWALLAQAYGFAPNFSPVYLNGSVAELRRAADANLPRAVTAARRAIALDPRNADAYVGLARAQELSGKWLDAEQSFKQAFSLDPLNPDGLNSYITFLYSTGRIREAVTTAEQLYALEPLVPEFNVDISNAFLAAGDNARALSVLRDVPTGPVAAQIYAAMGRYEEAANSLVPDRNPSSPVLKTAAGLIRAAPARARPDVPYLGSYSYVFAYVGFPERTFEWIEHNADAGYAAGQFNRLWQPNFTAARKTERFKALIRKLGLVDYWRARGWPDLCHSTTGDDFACS